MNKTEPRLLIKDLRFCGTFGLRESIRRYDPLVGASFEAYATKGIRGSIFSEIKALRSDFSLDEESDDREPTPECLTPKRDAEV